jgi:prolyl oligopeptidase
MIVVTKVFLFLNFLWRFEMKMHLSCSKIFLFFATFLLALFFYSCSKISTPPLTEVRMVKDTLHGELVSDPYRWLEDWNDPEVKSWSEQQNRFARSYLETLPGVQQIRKRLSQIYQTAFPSYYGLCWRGGRLFAKKYQPPLNQPILVSMTDTADPESEKIILDLNTFDPSHLTSMDWYEPSPDGKLVAVSLSKGGSEEGNLYLFDTASGEQLELVIPRVNGGTAGGDLAWLADGSGFYYTRYPRIGERPDSDLHFYQQVWFHELGTPIEKDRYIIGKKFPKISEITDRPIWRWRGIRFLSGKTKWKIASNCRLSGSDRGN